MTMQLNISVVRRAKVFGEIPYRMISSSRLECPETVPFKTTCEHDRIYEQKLATTRRRTVDKTIPDEKFSLRCICKSSC